MLIQESAIHIKGLLLSTNCSGMFIIILLICVTYGGETR